MTGVEGAALKTLAVITLVIAAGAAGAAAYAVSISQTRYRELSDRIDRLASAASALESSIGGLVHRIDSAAVQETGGGEASQQFAGRLTRAEEKLSVLERIAPATDSAGEAISQLSPSVREEIRRMVREEQAAAAAQQEQKHAARREEMHEKMKEMTEKFQQDQKKRLEEWVRKFAEKAGLTTAQEQGILDAYAWASEERNRLLREKHNDGGGLLMMGPEDFKKVEEKQNEKIKELLTEAQYGEYEEYSAANPLPMASFAVGVGPGGEEMGADAVIFQGAVSKETKPEQKPEKEGKDK
jgi:hypothetical protein